MRTDLGDRPFPFTCHAVRKPVQPFWAFLTSILGVSLFVILGFNDALIFPTERPEAETLRLLYFLLLAGVPLVALTIIPSGAGFRGVLPNRTIVTRNATWITPKIAPLELLLIACTGVFLAASGIVLIQIFGGLGAIFAAGLQWIVMGPGFVALGTWTLLYLLWQQLRGIKMTPESITYWRGIGRITLRWDDLGDAVSTNDVRDHEGYRKYLNRYMPGAKVVVPVESVMGVLLMVRWEDENTPRLLLETDHFTVEPSALLTAILALRDNTELRPLLGTRASKVLFVGPPWRVRRHMYGTQQWWPKGAEPDGIAVDSDGIVKEFQ